MTQNTGHHTLFELLRQGNLSSRAAKGAKPRVPETVEPEDADEILRRAHMSWIKPEHPED